MKEKCKTQLKYVENESPKCTTKIEKCKEQIESLELSVDYCSRHSSVINFVMEPLKCETSEEKGKKNFHLKNLHQNTSTVLYKELETY